MIYFLNISPTKEPNKMKKINILLILIVSFISFQQLLAKDVVEAIYAVVNGEIITLSELRNAEQSLIMQLQQKYSGEELKKEIEKLKKNLLNTLIDQKLILSKAKEKDYDVDKEVQMFITDIKKQNNLKSDAELKQALRQQGLTYEEFVHQHKMQRLKWRLIAEEVGQKLKADNSEIMAYYKKYPEKYTKPMKLELNCLFLNKENYLDQDYLKEKIKKINQQLKPENFKAVAQEHSELTSPDSNIYLGEYKKGDLNEKIEKVASQLEPGQHSSWIETDNGYYIVQLIKKTPPQMIPYKEVRESIRRAILEEKQEIELKKYIDRLKENSHIEIYKKY